jgi:hypothetical protein
LFTAESAKARCLKDKLAECKSKDANLEAMATEADRLHAGTLSAMEAKYVSRMSTLEDKLRSIVVAGHAACQAACAQPRGPASSSEVASQLRGIPRHLEEIAQYGLSTGAHMALVTIRTIYTKLNIGSIRGKPIDTDPLVYSFNALSFSVFSF